MNRPEPAVDMNLSEKAFSLHIDLPKIVLCDCLGRSVVQTLRSGSGSEHLLSIPKTYRSETPHPPMVLLHDAKGEPCEWIELWA